MRSTKSFKFVLILFIVMSLSILFLSSKSLADTKTGWEQVGGKWYYYKDGVKQYGRQQIDGNYYFLDFSTGAMYTGWYNAGSDEYPSWYYYDPNAGGAAASGWKKLSGYWYYFGSDYGAGYMSRDGGTKIGNSVYVFDKDGHLVEKSSDGWYSLTSKSGYNTYTKWYYLRGKGSNTTAYTGWLKLSGVYYYLNTYSGLMSDCVDYDEDGKIWCFDKSGKWLKNVNGWYEQKDTYYDEDGKVITYSNWYYFEKQNAITDVWKTIDGVMYYFDEGGIMATNPVRDDDGVIWVVDKNGAYIRNPKNGWFETEDNWYWIENHKVFTGWKQINGVWYYFDDYTGYMYSGGERYIYETTKSTAYYFQDSGAMVSNSWVKVPYTSSYNNKTYEAYSVYYYGETGAKVNKTETWAHVGGDWFYINNYGSTVHGTSMIINEKYYAFDLSGKCLMTKGWNGVEGYRYDYDAGKSVPTTLWYYVNNSNGELLVNKWLKDNGKWYYLNYNGQMNAGSDYWISSDQCFYGFNNDGTMKTNSWSKETKGENYSSWHYYGADGKSVKGQWVKDGNVWYYLDLNGTTCYNRIAEVNGKYYAFDSQSKLITKIGWNKYYDYSGKKCEFYVTNKDGVLKTKSWQKEANGDYYYLGTDGLMYRNVRYYVEISDGWFAFDENGKMINNAWWKYTRTEWVDGANTTKSDWLYAKAGGYLANSEWLEIDGKTYYFDELCLMVTGERDIRGQHYTFDENGVLTSGNSPIANTSLEPANAVVKDIDTIGNSMVEEDTVVDEKLPVETEPEEVVVDEVENETDVITEDNSTETTEEVTNEVIEDVSEDEILDSDEETEVIPEVTESETTNTVENETIVEDTTENTVEVETEEVIENEIAENTVVE